MRAFGRQLKNEFLTGMVLLAPIVGTVYLLVWVVRGVDGLLPEDWRPRIGGYPLPGLGLLSVLFLSLLVGMFARNVIGRRMVGLLDRLFGMIPLFGATYGLIKQVFESVFSQGADSFQRAVLVEYPRPGMYSIAFVTTSHGAPLISRPGQELISVFIPTTPNPTSGFYLLVEKSLVRDLDMPVQAAFRLLITMGIAREPDFMTTTARLRRENLTGV